MFLLFMLYVIMFFFRPLHMCVATWNVAVIKRWVEVSSPEEISQAINIPSSVGTALCMAASIRKDHEKGNDES